MNVSEWAVLTGAVLIALFFSIAHYTLRNPSRVRLERAFAGPRRAGWLKQLDDRLEDWLLVTALIRTVMYLFMMLAIVRLHGTGGWEGDLIALVIGTAVVSVFGIGLPHAWAKYAGEATLVVLWPAIRAASMICWPITRALKTLDLPVRRLSGHTEVANGVSEVEQEILQLASEGQAEGELDPDELEMITSVIEFHDSRVSEIMTPRTDIRGLAVTSTREECVRTILEGGHSRLPIYEDTLDSVVGVLYAKDLLGVAPEAPFDLATTMRKPFFVPETKAISDLLKEFRTQKVHMAIVLDEYGGTAGLITIEDLVEEIVGEITDEFEEPEPEVFQRIDETTVEVDARMYIDDLNDEMPINLPEEEDYDTVGGFVFSTLGYIPAAGEQFEYARAKFTVLEAEQRRINRIRIILPPAEEPEAEAS
ncbi:MAG: HlyC/CorC family transporter [Planctomycetes bacterium]|nr:HlyC/CorC family transporter [Planctomycetota bacterium]